MKIAISNIEDARTKLAETQAARSNSYKVGGSCGDCGDCGAKPGEVHKEGCDVEHCSVCGEQRLGCACKGHDKAFARWTGFWPGALESYALGIDLNDFYGFGFHLIYFVKPAVKK